MKKLCVISILAIMLLLALAGPAAAESGTVLYQSDHTVFHNLSNDAGNQIGALSFKYNTSTRYIPLTITVQNVYMPGYPSALWNNPNMLSRETYWKSGSTLIFTATEYFQPRIAPKQVGQLNYNNFRVEEANLSALPGAATIYLEITNTNMTAVGAIKGDGTTANDYELCGASSKMKLPKSTTDLNITTYYGTNRVGLKNTWEITRSGVDYSWSIGRTDEAAEGYIATSRAIFYNYQGLELFRESFQTGDTSETLFSQPNGIRVVIDFGGYQETIYDDRGEAGDYFHVVVRDASTGAILSSPTINVTELSTGATWGFTPTSGVQDVSGLMAGLLYNISATKTGYWGFWQNMQLISGCYYPTCYGNLVDLALVPITTPADPNQTTAAFRVYFQDSAYQGDQPVSGATITLSHPGYADLLGSTNSMGFKALTVNKSVEYTYQITKTGYYAASGTFNISDPTPILVRMYLAPQGTPTVTTLPTPIATGVTTIPNYMEDSAARRTRENELGNIVYTVAPGIATLFVLWIVVGIIESVGGKKRR